MMDLPDYVARRLRRPPLGQCMVRGSIPVVSFGDPRGARIASVGINPSWMEFLDGEHRELQGRDRRFETTTSLGVESLVSAADEVLLRALKSCYGYFQRNPYRRWFDQLERVLRPLGASYYDGSACHLDLVQWATDPNWNDVPPGARRVLTATDVPFLQEQLEENRFEILLLNGSRVIKEFQRALHVQLAHVADEWMYREVFVRISDGRTPSGQRVIAWSTNLQSSFGVSADVRRRLAGRVAMLTSGVH